MRLISTLILMVLMMAGLALVAAGCKPANLTQDDDTGGEDDDNADDDDTASDDDTAPSDICDGYANDVLCDGDTAVYCDAYGDIDHTEDCDTANDFYCWPFLGCILCYPNTRWCENEDVVECAGDGQSWSVVEDCDTLAGEVCDGGACISLCDKAEQERSSIGCKFYGVDMEQYPGYESLPYAIVVSNVNDTLDATVTVETKSGNTWTVHSSQLVTPGTLGIFNLPDNQYTQTGIAVGNAYRVISTIPVIAYQFNPLDGVSSFTSDASLLLPASAYDTVYIATAWGSEVPGFSIDDSELDIVAEVDGTQVWITPSVNTQAGGGIPAGTAGVQMGPFTLDEGDVLQIVNDQNSAYAQNLEGTLIETSNRVAVFGGHRCANAPHPGGGCCCDHVEEQVFGLQTWGTEYVAARIAPRNAGAPEASVWHIVAGQAATTLTFLSDAAVTGLPPGGQVTLGAGEAMEIIVDGSVSQPGDFHVAGTEAFLVTQTMSCTDFNGAGIGDPCMVQTVPVEQFLDRYVVLVPPTWVNDSFSLIREPGETISVEGTDVDSWPGVTVTPVPSGYEVVRIMLTTDGPYLLEGSAPFGVQVAGWDSYDSYCYPGGLNQEIINDL